MSLDYPFTPLSADEENIFEKELPRLVEASFPAREVIEIFMTHKSFLKRAAEVAKKKFDMAFAGIDATGNQLGFTVLRPEHVRRTTTDAGVTDTEWTVNVAVPGWADWLGTAAAPRQIDRLAMIAILGYINYGASPKSTAAAIRVDNITYPPNYFEYPMRLAAMSGAIPVAKLARPKAILPLGNLYTRAKYSLTGLDDLGLLGITFAEATYLQTETPTIESP